MPNTPPPVPSPDREMAEQQQLRAVVTGRLHRDSEADDWDSFLDSTSTFNPNAFNKRECAHRFAFFFLIITAHSYTHRLISLTRALSFIDFTSCYYYYYFLLRLRSLPSLKCLQLSITTSLHFVRE
jgi:hypothetical protein